MAQCSRSGCRTWRPDVAVRLAGVGVHVDGAWFCSDVCVTSAVTRRLIDVQIRDAPPRSPAVRLGAVLLQQRAITPRQLGEALETQKTTGLRLGAQLQDLGYASRELILRALAAQNGVSYLATIDPAAARTTPGRLAAAEVQALGVVPFREAGEVLLVACAAPLPRAALRALGALTGHTIEPFLVADDDFDRLRAAYGAAAGTSELTATVRDVPEGASRIAAAAVQAGAVTVKEAHVDPFMWVRIAAHGRISTLLVPPFPDRFEEQDEWLAATTRH